MNAHLRAYGSQSHGTLRRSLMGQDYRGNYWRFQKLRLQRSFRLSFQRKHWARRPKVKQYLDQMINALPTHSLIVADAGFARYPLFQKLLRCGHSFVIRVGGNVQLLTGLGYFHEERDELTSLWPQKSQSRHERL